MQLKGTIKKIYFKNDRWASIRVKTKDDILTCKGNIINPVEELSITMEGEYVEDPKYGLQFDVKSSEIEFPTNTSGIKAYLSSGLIKGVSETLAKQIVSLFGSKTLWTIENEPEKLLKIKGIGKKKLNAIIEGHKENAIFFELYALLKGNLTVNQAKKIMDKYGKDSVKIVKENPYTLIYDIDGIGFTKADAFAIAQGIKKDSILRVGAASYYVLKQAEMFGHCFSTMDALQHDVIKLLCPLKMSTLTEKKINSLYDIADEWEYKKDSFTKSNKLNLGDVVIIDEWIEERNHYLEILADAILLEIGKNHIAIDDDRIYSMELYRAETKVAETISKMIKQPPLKKRSLETTMKTIEEMELYQGFELGSQQKEAVIRQTENRFFVVTGGPGVGKTTTINTIIKNWGNDKKVVLCAPTGRAAQRMKEATGHEAGTIQRTMMNLDISLAKQRKKWREDDYWIGDEEMQQKEQKYLEELLFIVDEGSMIDITLAWHLLKHIQYATVVIVGDRDQLPPIGPGTFFKTLVENPHVSKVYLTEGYRNFGSIAQNSQKINNGISSKHFKFDEACVFNEVLSEKIKTQIIDTYMEKRKKYDPKDICVLVPMRKRSNSGSEELNKILQNVINPETKDNKLPFSTFRLHDRVMETSNNAKKRVRKDGIWEEGVFNGDCGTITNFDEEENEIEITFDDGRIANYERWEVENLELCYAMTIHKSQGSEYKCVIIALNREHYIMLKRKLLYTAITRAKKEAILLGDKTAYDMAIRTISDDARNTYLAERINSYF